MATDPLAGENALLGKIWRGNQMTKVLVLYYSSYGHIETVAFAAAAAKLIA